jgi:hypothetical protein
VLRFLGTDTLDCGEIPSYQNFDKRDIVHSTLDRHDILGQMSQAKIYITIEICL